LATEEVDDWLKEVSSKEIIENEDLVKDILGIEDLNIVETVSSVLVEEKDLENTSSSEIGIEEINDERIINLIMKPEEPGNDWQRAIRIELFSHAPIKILDEDFSVSYNTPFSFGEFSG
jgi:hypothetical protein